MLLQLVVRDGLNADVTVKGGDDDGGDEDATIVLPQVVSTLAVAAGGVSGLVGLDDIWTGTMTVEDCAELVGAMVPDVSPSELPVEAGMDRGGEAIPAGLDPTGFGAGIEFELELERLSV